MKLERQEWEGMMGEGLCMHRCGKDVEKNLRSPMYFRVNEPHMMHVGTCKG